jgi:AraC-like DNA-binding protein
MESRVGLSLTPEGELVLEHARRILGEIDDMEQVLGVSKAVDGGLIRRLHSLRCAARRPRDRQAHRTEPPLAPCRTGLPGQARHPEGAERSGTRHNGIGIRQGEEAYGVWRLSSGRANQLNPEGSRRSVVLVAIVAMSGTDELIAADTGASPTLAALASAAGYSKAQFVRLFRRTTGTSPHRYVLHRRLEEAQRLIKTSALPLAEVTSETGFASQSHLTNAFVRFFGCTPGDARRGARH